MLFRRRKRKTDPPPRIDGTVLVVDDDPAQRTEVASALDRTGVRVVECGHGDAVLPAIEEAAPDLVLLDINLPGRHGDELVGDIYARYPGTRVLLMTGESERVVAANTAHLPVFAVLEKPVPLRTLVRFVTSALATTRGAHPDTAPDRSRATA